MEHNETTNIQLGKVWDAIKQSHVIIRWMESLGEPVVKDGRQPPTVLYRN